MLEGENIVSAARKAIIRHDFSAVLTVFPILRHLKQTKPEFDQVLQVCGWGRPLETQGGGPMLPGLASQGKHLLRPHSSALKVNGSSFCRALGEGTHSWGDGTGREALQGGAGEQLARNGSTLQPRASLGYGRQHQEQAAGPHHLHGDRWSQGPGGLCRQHQGALPLSGATCGPRSCGQDLRGPVSGALAEGRPPRGAAYLLSVPTCLPFFPRGYGAPRG